MPKRLGSKLKELFGRSKAGEEFFEELEDMLIEADIGATVAFEVVDELRADARRSKLSSKEELAAALGERLRPYLTRVELPLVEDRLNVFLVLGVNGVGKTTTIAKLAQYYREHGAGEGVSLAAGDTFRAAAVEQLSLHGKKLGLRVVSQSSGADPGAVIFDTIESAKTRGERLVLADTAGRMHTKANLVAELGKVDRIVRSRSPGSNYKKLLVIDATTGQNGLRQAETFHEAVGVDAVVLAKYDSTARGGILVPIAKNLGLGCAYIGTGEKLNDLEPFDPDRYLTELVGGV